MSAVSAPKPDEAREPTSDADGWALLEALRRRLDEQAALGRKTQAQVIQLADSIAALVAQQRRRSLWLNVNSFVAYLMFTILCGAGCYLLYASRARELTAAREQAIGERDAAVRNADEATVRAVAREAADHKAWEVYQLLEVGKRGEAVAKLDALRDQPLSRTERAVLAARVHDTQVMEVDTALRAAVASFKAGRTAEMIKPLEAALTGEPTGARAATIHYYLGVAYAKTELDKALAHLQAAIAGDVDQEDARFQLASVLDRSGAYAQARAEYDRFATAHPQSQLAVFAMRRSATLVRLPAVAPPNAVPASGPAAAPSPAGLQPSGAAPPAAGPAAPTLPPSASLAPGAAAPGAPGTGASLAPGAPGAPGMTAPAVHVIAPAIRPAPAAAAPAAGTRWWPKPPAKPLAPWKPPAPRPAAPPGDPADPTVKPSAPPPLAGKPAPAPGEAAAPGTAPPPADP